jgi:Flp pilus assembly pilin Flp
LREETLGQDLIEYALLAGFITVIIGAMLPGQLLPPLKQMWVLIAAPLNWASGASS